MRAWVPGLFTPPARVSLGANQLGCHAAADTALKVRLIALHLRVLFYQGCAINFCSTATAIYCGSTTAFHIEQQSLDDRPPVEAPGCDGVLRLARPPRTHWL
jgi:hypothetical protein